MTLQTATVNAPSVKSQDDPRRPADISPETWGKLDEATKDSIGKLRAKAEAPRSGRLTLKVSEKGALSVYGLGRFPVTLYRDQWYRLIAAVPEIEAFAKANADKLTTKQS